MKITLLENPLESDWIEVKRRALVTIGKSKVVNEIAEDWKVRMLRSRHSPIRRLRISFYLEDVP